jgi:hypothetical protein
MILDSNACKSKNFLLSKMFRPALGLIHLIQRALAILFLTLKQPAHEVDH